MHVWLIDNLLLRLITKRRKAGRGLGKRLRISFYMQNTVYCRNYITYVDLDTDVRLLKCIPKWKIFWKLLQLMHLDVSTTPYIWCACTSCNWHMFPTWTLQHMKSRSPTPHIRSKVKEAINDVIAMHVWLIDSLLLRLIAVVHHWRGFPSSHGLYSTT